MGINRNLTKSQKKSVRRVRKRKAKFCENPKRTLVIQTNKANIVIKGVLRDILKLKRPLSIQFQDKQNKKRKKRKKKRPDFRPFENVSSIEKLGNEHDTSLFCVGSHNKKRPNNLIMGRMYDQQLLDMVEFGVENYAEITKNVKLANSFGSKPCLVFQGDEFINSEKHKTIKNFLIDFFRGIEVKRINLLGMDHVYVFTSSGEKIFFRHYLIEMKKPSSKGCMIDLKDIGPSMDLTIRRTRFATEDLRKVAVRKPQMFMKSKKRNKNVFLNPLGERMGKVHVKQQPIKQISLRKFSRRKKY